MTVDELTRVIDKLAELVGKGFDLSKPDGGLRISVRCSRCEPLVIQGVPTHETGCPNARRARRDEDEDDA